MTTENKLSDDVRQLRDIDLAILKEIYEWVPTEGCSLSLDVANYTTEESLAFEVVDHLTGDGKVSFGLWRHRMSPAWQAHFGDSALGVSVLTSGPAEAICRAALAYVRAKA